MNIIPQVFHCIVEHSFGNQNCILFICKPGQTENLQQTKMILNGYPLQFSLVLKCRYDIFFGIIIIVLCGFGVPFPKLTWQFPGDHL